MSEMAKHDFSALSDAICYIERCVPLPDKGLPEEIFLFASRLTPLVNVDLLIRNEEGHVLLTWRDDEIFGSGWHVPGGCIRLSERFADRIGVVSRDELGANVIFSPVPLSVMESIDNKRICRTHHVSILFDCKLLSYPSRQKWSGNELPVAGEWAWHMECPDKFLQPLYREILWGLISDGKYIVYDPLDVSD